MKGPQAVALSAMRAVHGPSARLDYAGRAAGVAEDLVGRLAPGGAVFGISASQFSALDVLTALLERTGPASVDLWTYAPGEAETVALGALIEETAITRLRLVIDESAVKLRAVETYKRLQARYADCIRVAKCHAKVMAVRGGGWAALIDGSANLAKNLRIEHVNIRDDEALCGLVERLTDEIFGSPAVDLDRVRLADAQRLARAAAGLPVDPEEDLLADAFGELADLDGLDVSALEG